jgi:hypothetical protein
MLGKLLKYEFRESARTLLPFLAASVVFGLFAILFINIGRSANKATLEYFSNFCLIMFVLTLFVIFIVYIVVIIRRFYKNLLTDEGYLMFTLPVSTSALLWSKIIVALVSVIVVSAISSLMVYFIITAYDISLNYSLNYMLSSLFDAVREEGLSLTQIILQIVLLFLSSILTFILMLYTSMSVGYSFNHHKQLYSVLTFFGILILLQLLLGGEMTQIAFRISNSYSSFESSVQIGLFASNLLWIQTGIFVALCIIFYFITYWMLSKHLNLE